VRVQNGVTMIYQELTNDPLAASIVQISSITFADQAYQTAFVPITQFTPPALQANGACAFGGALHLLNESLDHDIIPHRGRKVKGDFKPLVFLLTDGHFTDHWQTEAQRLMSRNVYTIGIGVGADMNVIRQITRAAMLMQDFSFQIIRGLFSGYGDSEEMIHDEEDDEILVRTVPHSEEPQLINLNSPPPGLVVNLGGPTTQPSIADKRLTVFISYSRADSVFADKLDSDLRARGCHTWMDRQGLEGGDDWARVIPREIARRATHATPPGGLPHPRVSLVPRAAPECPRCTARCRGVSSPFQHAFHERGARSTTQRLPSAHNCW